MRPVWLGGVEWHELGSFQKTQSVTPALLSSITIGQSGSKKWDQFDWVEEDWHELGSFQKTQSVYGWKYHTVNCDYGQWTTKCEYWAKESWNLEFAISKHWLTSGWANNLCQLSFLGEKIFGNPVWEKIFRNPVWERARPGWLVPTPKWILIPVEPSSRGPGHYQLW